VSERADYSCGPKAAIIKRHPLGGCSSKPQKFGYDKNKDQRPDKVNDLAATRVEKAGKTARRITRQRLFL
jgi:hypothetical protein